MLKVFSAKKTIFIAAVALMIIGLNSHVASSKQAHKIQTQSVIQSSSQISEDKPLVLSDNTASTAKTVYKRTPAFTQYKPRYGAIQVHPSNYGDRHKVDVNGKALNNMTLVVLHETTNSAVSAINTFRTYHPNDNDQVSYHVLIALDGTIIYLVPSEKRAFGAGNSAFKGSNGIEAVQTNPNIAASVNNFAYHVSLETPVDGRGKANQNSHSGYTEEQYKSLAWLVALSEIPEERITTHQDVDRSGRRFDPRSFDRNKFLAILRSYRQPVDETSLN